MATEVLRKTAFKGDARLVIFSLIADQMSAVDQRLKEVLEQQNPVVEEVSDYLQEASGKRLRPALVLMAGQFGQPGRSTAHLLDVAVAVELIHMATLVHDDIIDNAELRRGLPAVRSRFSDPVAVLAGDFLFARAFQLLSATRRPKLVNLAAQVVYVMSTGEIGQHLDQGQFVSEDGYWRRVEAKTGFFLETCCQLGATASYADRATEHALGQYGHHIGLAYQVVDDLFDWIADPTVLGKAVGEDLASGIITLPVIRTMQDERYGAELRERLADNPLDIRAIRGLITESGAMTYCRERAGEHLQLARQALEGLPDSAEREELIKVAEFIGARDH